MNLLPAVLLGGPPHSGKSVLSYSLSQELRKRRLEHYLLHASPDGEGDWSNEADQRLVQQIRFKGPWTPYWIEVTCRDIANRPLPLLVDAGGLPTPEQEVIFDQCTHAVVLTRDPAQRDVWLEYVRRHDLTLLADLQSRLGDGADDDATFDSLQPVLTGTLTGLERGAVAGGALFAALVERIAALFNFSADDLFRKHCASAPWAVEGTGAPAPAFVNLDVLAGVLYPHGERRFKREDLPRLLALIPADTPIALYGRGPNWVAAAIAASRHVQWQFDVRLGWVQPPALRVCAPGDEAFNQNDWVSFHLERVQAGWVRLCMKRVQYYLDHARAAEISLPYIAPSDGVEIEGPMPLWLVSAIARAYRDGAPLRAITAFQPQSS